MNEFVNRQIFEVAKDQAKHAPIHSAHEGYAVILEELDEFKAEELIAEGIVLLQQAELRLRHPEAR